MCECCSNNAAAHQGHVHVNGVECANCFDKLQKSLSELPGVISVEFITENKQAKVLFDKRIIDIRSLEQTVDENGFSVS